MHAAFCGQGLAEATFKIRFYTTPLFRGPADSNQSLIGRCCPVFAGESFTEYLSASPLPAVESACAMEMLRVSASPPERKESGTRHIIYMRIHFIMAYMNVYIPIMEHSHSHNETFGEIAICHG